MARQRQHRGAQRSRPGKQLLHLGQRVGDRTCAQPSRASSNPRAAAPPPARPLTNTRLGSGGFASLFGSLPPGAAPPAGSPVEALLGSSGSARPPCLPRPSPLQVVSPAGPPAVSPVGSAKALAKLVSPTGSAESLRVRSLAIEMLRLPVCGGGLLIVPNPVSLAALRGCSVNTAARCRSPALRAATCAAATHSGDSLHGSTH